MEMIEKSCLDCGHRKICGRFYGAKALMAMFLDGHSEMSDEKAKKAIRSVATCFGTICAEWLIEAKSGE